MKAKTLGIPGPMLKDLENRARLINEGAAKRPDNVPGWQSVTWGDIVRAACTEYLERNKSKATKKRRTRA